MASPTRDGSRQPLRSRERPTRGPASAPWKHLMRILAFTEKGKKEETREERSAFALQKLMQSQRGPHRRRPRCRPQRLGVDRPAPPAGRERACAPLSSDLDGGCASGGGTRPRSPLRGRRPSRPPRRFAGTLRPSRQRPAACFLFKQEPMRTATGTRPSAWRHGRRAGPRACAASSIGGLAASGVTGTARAQWSPSGARSLGCDREYTCAVVSVPGSQLRF